MSLSNLKIVQWQRLFEHQMREARIARILHVARTNPDLPFWALHERFNEINVDSLRKLLAAHGLSRQDDDVMTYRDSIKSGGVRGGPFNGWRRTGADVASIGRRRRTG